MSRMPVLLAFLLLAGCGVGADVLRLDQVIRPQTVPDSVLLLAKEPNAPYTVIALVSVTSGDRGVDVLRRRLVTEAARLGGHAVLLDSESLARGEDGRRLSARVIVFSRAPEHQPQSNPRLDLPGARTASAGATAGALATDKGIAFVW